MHFGCKLFSDALFVFFDLSDLLLFNFFGEICSCGFVIVHELVPLFAELLKLGSLAAFGFTELLFVQ